MIQQRDMPTDLSEAERIAYRKGWDGGAARFIKANGLPNQHVTGGVTFSEATRRYHEDREPVAHKAGMSALTRYRKLCGVNPPPRKTAAKLTHCPNCGEALTSRAA